MTDTRQYDIVVIGGGPAGAATALFAARAGYSVCVLERHSFPRETLCGEFLSREVLTVLTDLDLRQDFFALAPSRITEFHIAPDRQPSIQVPLGFTAYGMRRSVFDTMLLTAARARGVLVVQPGEVDDVRQGTNGFEILYRTPSGAYSTRARLVVGAYGRTSPLDKQLKRAFAGERSGMNGVKWHVPASMIQNVNPEEILIGLGPEMYCGVNHVDGGNITLCFLERRTNRTPPPRQRIQDLAEQNAGFARVLTPEALHAIETLPVYGTGNIYFGRRRVVENGVLMVGDAARVIAPVAGDGIGMALESAQVLGRILERARGTPYTPRSVAELYQAQWEIPFRHRVRTALFLQRILLSRGLRRFALPLVRHAPFVLRIAFAATRAKASGLER